jgi:hypothetical protein
MNQEYARRRLVDAETNLARALQRLHTLRRAALAGGYDPVAFDRALVAYRRAEREALEAREALATGRPDPAPPVEVPDVFATAFSPAFEPTPAMRFARWLVVSGRLSEWELD